jgi:hypothetical protein
MDAKAVNDQLAALRMVTSMTGAVHDAQLEQLKYWIHIVFPHAEKYGNLEVSVPDDDGESEHLVRYNLILGKNKAPKNFKALLTALSNSIHDLLGDEWLVQIMNGDKKIYEGIRKVSPSKNSSLSLSKSANAPKKRKRK